MTFIGLTLTHLFSHSFHATRYARAAARYNHVSVGVEDFKRNLSVYLFPSLLTTITRMRLCVDVQTPAELKMKASDTAL